MKSSNKNNLQEIKLIILFISSGILALDCDYLAHPEQYLLP